MSVMEKHVAQIFERRKRIVEQSRQQCHLWERHLFPKLLLNGIPPPPWLCNSSLHTDPQELNKDDIVSQVLLSQPQYRVPFPGVYSNLDAVSYGVQYPINQSHGLGKECNAGDGVSNLPDGSVNYAVCASSGPPELDSGTISPPQNQIEAGALNTHHDPAVSLAKLQRSKSRQRALEQRNSAKAPKRLSEDNNAGVCAGTVTGSASSTQQEEHVLESDVVKGFHSNIQSCSMEEMEPYVTNYSGLITRSRSLSQKKFNSSNVASSGAKEDDPPPNNLNKSFEIVNQPCFENGSCGINEANKGEYQSKEAGKNVYVERLRKSGSSNQARYNSELLKHDSTLASSQGVEFCDRMQLTTHSELTDLSKACDCNSGSGRNTVKGDLLMTGGSAKSIDKSVPSCQPLISQNSEDPVVSVVGFFSSQKNPDFSAVKKDRLSRSGSGKVEKVSKSSRSNYCEQSATSSQSASKKSRNVESTKLDGGRLSSNPNFSKFDIEIRRNSAEKESIAPLAASGNTRAVMTCAKEGSSRPVSSSNIDGGSLLAESVYIGKALDAQENIPSGAIPIDNVEHRSATIDAEVNADFDRLVEKDPSCVMPKVDQNVSVLKLPSDFILSVMPRQLDFDVDETNMSGICSPDLKEGQQGVPPVEEPLNLLEPVNLLEEVSSPVCQSKRNSSREMPSLQMQELMIRDEGHHVEYCASHFKTEDIARTTLSVVSPNKERPMVQNDFCILSLMNNSSPSQVALENSSRSLPKEVMSTKFDSISSKLKNDESSSKLADSSSEAVSGNDLHKSTDENVTNFTVGFPFSAPMDGVIVGLAQQSPNSITLCEHSDLLRQTLLSDGKITRFSTGFEIFRSSTERFTFDVEHSCPMHKRRKVEIERERFPPASSNLLEKTGYSIEQRPVSRSLSTEADNQEVALEVQHLPSNQEDDIGHQYISNVSTDEMQYNGECQAMEGSSLKVRKEEKCILDGRDRSEGFIMQMDNAQPFITGDQMDLGKINLPSNSIDYTSLGKSRFIHSSLTPYKLHNIPELHQSLPNGLLEGISISLPLNDGSPRSLSDCQPNCKGQYTSSVQTLWDRLNSNLGSSGKRKSLKLDLPCITEENDNLDEIADTFQRGIDSEQMASSNIREPLAEIEINVNPSTSVLQEDMLTDEHEDILGTKFNIGGTCNKVKHKLDMQDGNSKRFTGKGNQNISLGGNGVKKTAESVCKRPGRRLKLSGKDSMKQGHINNIVCNVSSFVPLVQQKQAAAVVTGKRDIKVKALEAAEAAKRMAEKKENERKRKKEVMRLEREKLELELQKKKKEEEQKKKEAQMAAKKRQREEEEKKEKEKKRKRVNDMKQQQQEHEKIQARKEEIKVHCRATGEVQETRKFMDERENHKNLPMQDKRECNMEKISETKPLAMRDLANEKELHPEYLESVNDCANNGKVMDNLIKTSEDDDIMGNSLQEQSYDISPYRCSDDEDEDEDDMPNNKFIPMWASKHSLSLIVSCQKMDPETIFPPQSFCNITEVLLPRKFQLR